MKKYAVLLIPLVLALISYYVQGVAEGAYSTFANGTTYYQSTLQEGERLEPAAQYVLIIVMDSLRYEDSLQLLHFNTLRGNGADFLSHVGQPSYSLPGYVTIPTGASPEITGVTSNYYRGELVIDNIFKAAKDAGLTTGVVSGSDAWEQLFGDYIDFCYSFKSGEKELSLIRATNAAIKEKSVEVIEMYRPNLLLVHFSGTDEASHRYGGNSPEYKEMASQQDAYIAEILEHYRIDETVVFVTSDHGHIDRGGHGGWEKETVTVPLVMYGVTVNTTRGEAEDTDIAPTVAAVLGIRIPTHAQGRILLEGMDVPEEKKASWLLQLAEQKKRFTQFYLGVIAREKEIDLGHEALDFFDAGNYTESMESSKKFISATGNLMEEAKKEKIAGERLRRVPLFLLIVMVPPLAAFLGLRRKWITKKTVYAAFLCGVLYVILFNVIFFSLNTYSLSTINDDPDIGPFFDAVALFGIFLPLIIMAFLGVYLRKEGKYYLIKSCWISSAAISYFIMVQVGFHCFLQDNGISWYMPDMMLGFKYYVDAMQYIPMGYTSFLHPFIAVVVAFVAGKLFK